MKTFLILFSVVMPWRLKRLFLRGVFGYSLHPSAYIGFSYVAPSVLDMQAGAKIGHFSVIKANKLIMGENSLIGAWNWITSITDPIAFMSSPTRAAVLSLGRESAITSRHYIDVQDAVSLGEFATLAGVRSSIFTHGIDIARNCQVAAPVSIGDYSYVGTNVIILAGASVPARSVVAAGAVVTSCARNSSGLYGGVPAVLRREWQSEMQHFHRKVGPVS